MYILCKNGLEVGKVLVTTKMTNIHRLCYIVDEEELLIAKLSTEVIAIYSDECYNEYITDYEEHHRGYRDDIMDNDKAFMMWCLMKEAGIEKHVYSNNK